MSAPNEKPRARDGTGQRGDKWKQGQSSSQGAHVKLEPGAITAGEIILASAMRYQDAVPMVPPLETFPTVLQPVARAIMDALEAGAKEWTEVLAFHQTSNTGPDGESLFAEITEISEAAAQHPTLLQPAIDRVREYSRVRSQQFACWRLETALAEGDHEQVGRITKELAELAEDAGGDLLEAAYQMAFDPATVPPPDEVCLTLAGEYPVAATGNLTVVQGRAKTGKSAVVAAVLGSAMRRKLPTGGDTLAFEWCGSESGAILHLDTEQSPADWHALVNRAVTRSGLPSVPERLVSLPLVRFARSDRLAILEQALARESRTRGGVALVVLDGVADLCASPNDEAESLELVSRLMALAHQYSVAVVCVLHENPGSEAGKTRGHLGSELNRKAFGNLRIDKDGETGVSNIWGSDMRKKDIPAGQGFCFAWDDSAGMHVYKGRAAGMKAALREADAATDARELFGEIFANGDAIGKNEPFPMLTPTEAAEIYRETIGNGKYIKPDAMKKRMQKAESLGVLGKASRNEWRIIPSGTSGKDRENIKNSRP